ncbi:XRE family transcriptional regulator [Mycolicibacterium austroafricanum]|uniref:helix-turn-helix domain-containing protein n=1 Tax=Mycolicibacterium austroafricanum TaxID=39687 RepID=UPI001ABF7722|nr:XRE family transcriptional regulator [Mycolicibacterium austroafricanum]QRZ05781.1 helix-turn-helix domain-containing protein [Mycolicibacterium austroafricanum]QZT67336.1 XRE family transcriptional regulator [Mycolicibacterium austroafricanum]
MDHLTLGQRVARAREHAGIPQSKLAEMVKMERTALGRAEKGERKLAMTEMVAIAEALRRPLAFFVSEPLPAVVSRRSDNTRSDETSQALDDEIEVFASDAQTLFDLGLLQAVTRSQEDRTPQDFSQAEDLARRVRDRLQLDTGPIYHLADVCERVGLVTYAAALGENGPDGGCVEVRDGLAVSVVNGEAKSGRRRMTLAHELGHWICGDAYDGSTGDDHEKMINAFAIHFLAPRAGVQKIWNEHDEWSVRDRALAVGSIFRLSWSAVVSQLRNLGLISYETRQSLLDREPRHGDYVALKLSWDDEPKCPYVSPGFAAACVEGYTSGRLTAARTIELLRGTMKREDLPEREAESLDSVRKLFAVGGD